MSIDLSFSPLHTQTQLHKNRMHVLLGGKIDYKRPLIICNFVTDVSEIEKSSESLRPHTHTGRGSVSSGVCLRVTGTGI